jgi:regulator of sigma E protease
MESSLFSTIYDTLYTPVMFVIVLSVVVFIHEFGHFWVARRNGVRCEAFSIGFGPELFGWTDRHDTRWKVCALPLGGYVKMFGMEEEPIDEETGEPRPFTEDEKKVAFNEKSLGQRAAVVVAGPAANFLLAIVVFAFLAMAVGSPDPSSRVGDVVADSAAEAAGIQPGDVIVSVDGATVTTFEDLTQAIRPRAGDTLVIGVDRDGQVLDLVATPGVRELGSETVGLLGVGAARITAGPAEALWQGVVRTYDLTVQIIQTVGGIITGGVSVKELGGPLSIAKWSGEVAQAGVFVLLNYIALISVNLGLINLFPIPVLDGGHLVMYAIERVRGRPPGERFQEYSLRFGLAFIILLMLFVTWNDVMHHDVFGIGG